MTRPVLPSGRAPYPPAGMAYDGIAKDWRLDAYGQVESCHPVDEGMALSMRINKGSVKSSPTTGNELFKIVYLSVPNLAEQVRAAVMSSHPLARLVSEGKAIITRIDHEVRESRLVVSPLYRNLELETARGEQLHERRLEWYSDG